MNMFTHGSVTHSACRHAPSANVTYSRSFSGLVSDMVSDSAVRRSFQIPVGLLSDNFHTSSSRISCASLGVVRNSDAVSAGTVAVSMMMAAHLRSTCWSARSISRIKCSCRRSSSNTVNIIQTAHEVPSFSTHDAWVAT